MSAESSQSGPDMEIGKTYLVTTSAWFVAPDGESYKAVFGTIHAVCDATQVLGIRTNAKSTNWYIEIGCMIVAGCQIEYVIRTDEVSLRPPSSELTDRGKVCAGTYRVSRIFCADAPNEAAAREERA